MSRRAVGLLVGVPLAIVVLAFGTQLLIHTDAGASGGAPAPARSGLTGQVTASARPRTYTQMLRQLDGLVAETFGSNLPCTPRMTSDYDFTVKACSISCCCMQAYTPLTNADHSDFVLEPRGFVPVLNANHAIMIRLNHRFIRCGKHAWVIVREIGWPVTLECVGTDGPIGGTQPVL